MLSWAMGGAGGGHYFIMLIKSNLWGPPMSSSKQCNPLKYKTFEQTSGGLKNFKLHRALCVSAVRVPRMKLDNCNF